MTRWLFAIAGALVGAAAMVLLSGRSGDLAPLAVGGESAIGSEWPDDDDASPRERLVGQDGTLRIALTGKERALAGIESTALEPILVAPEIACAGEVVDAALIAADAGRISGARRLLAARRESARAISDRLAQLRGLGQDGELLAVRERAALELSWRQELERVAAAESQLAAATSSVTARWGRTLGAAILDADARVQALIDGGAWLIAFALPPGHPAPEPGVSVAVGAHGERGAAAQARMLGPSPLALGFAAGATFFAHATLDSLRAGMRVTVWVPQAQAPVRGVLLPSSALVWHAGRRWYFVEPEPNVFERRPLTESAPHHAGAVLPGAQAPQSAVVIVGGQSLLAEEFRERIPEEDED